MMKIKFDNREDMMNFCRNLVKITHENLTYLEYLDYYNFKTLTDKMFKKFLSLENNKKLSINVNPNEHQLLLILYSFVCYTTEAKILFIPILESLRVQEERESNINMKYKLN
jgi:hypothetical protein